MSGCSPGPGEVGIGLKASVTVSEPANTQFFTPGESLEIAIKFTDRCEQPVNVIDLDLANLYITGPRTGLRAKTATRLLNCITDRNAADDQHHFVDLQDPHFADPSQENYGEAEDGTIIFRTGAISGEEAGTYTVGVWARTKDEQDQLFAGADFQLGTAAREEYASGRPGAFPACGRCHWGPNTGKIYLAHTRPIQNAASGLSAPKRMKGLPASYIMGNWALDFTPIETCMHCHNADGYSPIPLVHKAHGVHRGHKMVKPGIAHPEITQLPGGLPADPTLEHYLDVGYPSMPEGERDCTQCHVDDRWKTSPSALACVSCHETLDLGTGVIDPARVYGKPGAANCTSDQACVEKFGKNATCKTATGVCEARTHPTLASKPNCAECHTPDDPGTVADPKSPVSKKHSIPLRDKATGYKLIDASLSGGTGPNGAFTLGDVPKLKFKAVDKTGAAVNLNAKSSTGSDLYRVEVLLSGPTHDRQRVVNAFDRTALVLGADGWWTYSVENKDATGVVRGLPASSLAPYNAPATVTGRVNPAGTYTLHFYVSYNPGYGYFGTASSEAAGATANFRFCPSPSTCGAEPVRPRQVILSGGCTSCHITVTSHGGMRTDVEGCSSCHTAGTVDRAPGAKGRACTSNAGCKGFVAGDKLATWEECQDAAGNDGVLDTCVMIARGRLGKPCTQHSECFGHDLDPAIAWEYCEDKLGADGLAGTDGTPDTCVASVGRDPTADRSVEFTNMIHSIHYARRRGGYSERDRLLPGLIYVGYYNEPLDFSEMLFPLDMRNCTKCHLDSGEQCLEEEDNCGVGQACRRGKCVNVAWTTATNGRPCLACHDTEGANAHVALNTWRPEPGVEIESCTACHDENREFSPAKVHEIAAPYVPPYPRSFARKQ